MLLTAFTRDRNLIQFSHVRRARAAWLLSASRPDTPGLTARRAAPSACPARCRDPVQRHGLAAVHDPGMGTPPRPMGRAHPMAQRRTGLACVRPPVHPPPQPPLRTASGTTGPSPESGARGPFLIPVRLHAPPLPNTGLPKAIRSNILANIVLGARSTDFVDDLLRTTGRGRGRLFPS
jgi:hypothetical protein